MGRSLAMNAARRVRHAVSRQSLYGTPAVSKHSKTYDYERVGLSAAEGRPARAVRLGGKSRVRVAGLQGIINTPSNLISKLWASYGKLRDSAKETNVSVFDVFVGSQMLGQVCATPMRSHKKKPVASVPAAASRSSRVSSSSKVSPPKNFRVGRSASFKRR